MSFIKNSKVELRALEPEDVDLIYSWENERTACDASALPAPVSRFQVWQYIQDYTADPFSTGQLRLMIVDAEKQLPVGHVDIFDFDVVNQHASIGIFVSKEYRRQGIAHNAISLLCGYCKATLNMHQLSAHIAVDNAPSQAMFEQLGFKSCGRLRSWLRRGAGYVDVLIYQKLLTD